MSKFYSELSSESRDDVKVAISWLLGEDEDETAIGLDNADLRLKIVQIDPRKISIGKRNWSEQTARRYAKQMRAGDEFPPLVVFRKRQHWILLEGGHRLHAAILAGLRLVDAIDLTGITVVTDADKLEYFGYKLEKTLAELLTRTKNKVGTLLIYGSYLPDTGVIFIVPITRLGTISVKHVKKAYSTLNRYWPQEKGYKIYQDRYHSGELCDMDVETVLNMTIWRNKRFYWTGTDFKFLDK